jgi:hypothetical protein
LSLIYSFCAIRCHGIQRARAAPGVIASSRQLTLPAATTIRPGLNGPTRSWIKVKVRQEGRFVLGGILGLPHTFAGILVGEHVGRRLIWRGTVEWGLGLRTAKELLRRGRERSTSPFHDFRLSRGVTWLEPTRTVELTYSEIMEGRLRDPVYRGLDCHHGLTRRANSADASGPPSWCVRKLRSSRQCRSLRRRQTKQPLS